MTDALIQQLQAVLTDSVTMLDLAERAEWDALLAKEQERQEKISALRESYPDHSMVPESEPWRSQAVDVIEKVIDLDARTRNLTQQWMDGLARDLGELQRAQKVGRAYLGG